MKNMKVSAKITLGFGIVLLLTLVLVVSVFITNMISNSALNDLNTINSFEISANEFDIAFSNSRYSATAMMFDLSEDEYRNAVAYYNSAVSILTGMRDTAADTPLLLAYSHYINPLLGNLAAWRSQVDRIADYNRRVIEHRDSFAELEAAGNAAAINIGAMQLQNLESDIRTGAEAAAMLRRHGRVSNAVDISNVLSDMHTRISEVFDLIDLATLPGIRADAYRLFETVDAYIANSTQLHDVAAGQAVHASFSSIMELVDEFELLVYEREGLVEATRLEAGVLIEDVDYVLDEVTIQLLDRLEAAQDAGRLSLIMAIAMGAAALVIGVFVAISIIRSISAPINRLVKLVNDVSDGNLNVNIDRANVTRDEIGDVTRSTYNLVERIRSISDDLVAFSSEYVEVGDIEYRIDESKYQGAYLDIVKGINSYADSVLDDVFTIFSVLDSVNEGNFDIKIKQMPGKKVVMNQKADALMANLSGVNNDMSAMIEALAVKGDVRHSIDETKYLGDWRKIAKGLNDISGAIETPISEIQDSLARFNAGYFDKTILGDYPGIFGEIKNDVNTIIKGLGEYVAEIDRSLSAIAEGDLTQGTSMQFDGDFSMIGQSINKIAMSLRTTMSEINAASEQVFSGAKQISTSAMDLANGATEQASSVEELNASVDMITQQTKQNADNAGKANELSNKSTENANEGNDAMEQMAEAMLQIKESSSNISRIIRTIQDIAFQTNLLALNAAVEAARAGEHGRGFAVVAEEVRSLAARSQVAATETTELIEDSINRVDQGSGIAQTTAEALNIIVSNANEMLDIINNISTSSREQAEAVEQVSIGLGQISTVVQSNSAVSEETAAAAEELSSQSELLRQLVSYFKI